ncbi:MAG: glycosyltransferase family 87 protein [Anaerolineales bacterium]
MINTRRILANAGIISLFLIYAFVWLSTILIPSQRTGADFISFYTAGQIAQQNGFSHVYDLQLQQSVQEKIVGFKITTPQVLPFNHIPFLIPLLALVALPNYIVSFMMWDLILICAYIMGFRFLFMSLPSNIRSRAAGIGAFLFYPVFVSIVNGQDTAFLFLAFTALVYALHAEKYNWAGIALAFSWIRPQVAVFIAIPFLLGVKRGRFAFVVTSILLAGFSMLLIGRSGVINFVNIISLTASNSFYGIKPQEMLNFVGILTRSFNSSDSSTINFIAEGGFVIGVTTFSIAWLRKGSVDFKLIGATIIGSVFFSLHLHFHDLSLLIIPFMIAMSSIVSKTKIASLELFSLGFSFLFLSCDFLPILKFTIPYLAMIGLLLALYFPDRIQWMTKPQKGETNV